MRNKVRLFDCRHRKHGWCPAGALVSTPWICAGVRTRVVGKRAFQGGQIYSELLGSFMRSEQEENVVVLYKSPSHTHTYGFLSFVVMRRTNIVACPHKPKPSCDSVMEIMPICVSTHTSDALAELGHPSCLRMLIDISYCILALLRDPQSHAGCFSWLPVLRVWYGSKRLGAFWLLRDDNS